MGGSELFGPFGLGWLAVHCLGQCCNSAPESSELSFELIVRRGGCWSLLGGKTQDELEGGVRVILHESGPKISVVLRIFIYEGLRSSYD